MNSILDKLIPIALFGSVGIIMRLTGVIHNHWEIITIMLCIIGYISTLFFSTKKAINIEVSTVSELKQQMLNLYKEYVVEQPQNVLVLLQIKETLMSLFDTWEDNEPSVEIKSKIKKILSYLHQTSIDYEAIPRKSSDKQQIALQLHKEALEKIKVLTDELYETINNNNINNLKITNSILHEKTNKQAFLE